MDRFRPSPGPLRTIAAILLLVLLGPSLLAQQPLSETMDVTVVQIPVVVMRNARAVEGLTRDDFEVFVNGKRQPIAYFDVLDFAVTPPAARPGGKEIPAEGPASAVAAVDLAQRRLTMLLFDIANSTIGQMKLARQHVAQTIAAAAPSDFFAVATYSRGSTVQYVTPFTRDRAVVMRAVATLAPSGAEDVLALAISPEERATLRSLGRLAPPSGMTELAYHEDLVAAIDDMEKAAEARESRAPSMLGHMAMDKEWRDRSAATNWALALGSVADEMKHLEGVKQVLLFSEAATLADVSAVAFGPQAERMHQRFRGAGTVLNVVDVAGLRAHNDVARRLPVGGFVTPKIPSSSQPPYILYQASLPTGGTVMANSGIENNVRHFFATRGVTYLLGIRPPANERDENEITVKLKAKKGELSYRRGYARGGQRREINGLQLADMLLNDIHREDVTVNVSATTGERLTVEVGFPSDEILAHARAGQVTVDVFIYVFDAASNVVASRYRRMVLEEQRARQTLKGAEIVRRERFDLADGPYRVKALVHIVGRDLVGFERVDVASR